MGPNGASCQRPLRSPTQKRRCLISPRALDPPGACAACASTAPRSAHRQLGKTYSASRFQKATHCEAGQTRCSISRQNKNKRRARHSVIRWRRIRPPFGQVDGCRALQRPPEFDPTKAGSISRHPRSPPCPANASSARMPPPRADRVSGSVSLDEPARHTVGESILEGPQNPFGRRRRRRPLAPPPVALLETVRLSIPILLRHSIRTSFLLAASGQRIPLHRPPALAMEARAADRRRGGVSPPSTLSYIAGAASLLDEIRVTPEPRGAVSAPPTCAVRGPYLRPTVVQWSKGPAFVRIRPPASRCFFASPKDESQPKAGCSQPAPGPQLGFFRPRPSAA